MPFLEFKYLNGRSICAIGKYLDGADMLTELTLGEDGGVILGGELPEVAGVSSKSTDTVVELSRDPRRTSLTKGTKICEDSSSEL